MIADDDAVDVLPDRPAGIVFGQHPLDDQRQTGEATEPVEDVPRHRKLPRREIERIEFLGTDRIGQRVPDVAKVLQQHLVGDTEAVPAIGVLAFSQVNGDDDGSESGSLDPLHQ